MGMSILYRGRAKKKPPKNFTKNPQNQSFNRVLRSGDLKNRTGRVFLPQMHYISAQELPGEPKNVHF